MDDSQEITLTEKQRHWLEQLRACEASGQGIAAYAAAHGLDARAMYTGKKILVKKGVLPRTRRSRFQRVQVKDTVASATWRIQLPNGLSVAFSGTVDAKTLSTVLTLAAAVD
jgi:hypothetical protein